MLSESSRLTDHAIFLMCNLLMGYLGHREILKFAHLMPMSGKAAARMADTFEATQYFTLNCAGGPICFSSRPSMPIHWPDLRWVYAKDVLDRFGGHGTTKNQSFWRQR
jgi:hypothetical protein